MKIDPAIFYKDAQLTTPPNISHRHFRLRNGNVWIKLFQVQDINELRDYLIRFAPDQAYVSVSCYLQPELVGLKWKQKAQTYRYMPNIILSSDFFMDFDQGKVNSMLHLLRAYDFLRDQGHDKFMGVQTNRGSHLWDLAFYEQECHKNIPHKPFAREKFILSKKRELCSKLESYKVEWDKDISLDNRRIAKLGGSLSDDTFICKAYSNINLMAKEFSKSYLPNETEAKRGHKRILPNEINLMLGAVKH